MGKSKGKKKPDPNAVVVILEYAKKKKHNCSRATISFGGPRPDDKVLAAKAEMIPGVKNAFMGIGGLGQELELSFTEFYDRSKEQVLGVLEEVLKTLELTVIDEIVVRVDKK